MAFGLRLPFTKKKSESISMPRYVPGTAELTGMTKGTEGQVKQLARMRQQRNRLAVMRAGGRRPTQ